MNSGKAESDNDDRPDWFERNSLFKHKVFAGSLILVVGFAISVGIAYGLKSLIGIGIMGICILITVLIGGNVLSKEHELTTGEVRRAIAISCISVFFGLLAVGDTITMNNKVLETVLENFWWIIITIIGFYFGGRSGEEIVKRILEKRAETLEKEVKDTSKKVEEIKKKVDDIEEGPTRIKEKKTEQISEMLEKITKTEAFKDKPEGLLGFLTELEAGTKKLSSMKKSLKELLGEEIWKELFEKTPEKEEEVS